MEWRYLSDLDELPNCSERNFRAEFLSRIRFVCPYEVDNRLFDFAESVFEPFMPKLDEQTNQAIFRLINNSQRWSYEYENLSSELSKSQSLLQTLTLLALALSGIGILSLVLLLLKLTCDKLGYFSKPQKAESRVRLFLRICTYITLFIAVLLSAIGYCGTVTDIDTRWIFSSNLKLMDDELKMYKSMIHINRALVDARSSILKEFDTLDEDELPGCKPSSSQDNIENVQKSVNWALFRAHNILERLDTLKQESAIESEELTAALMDVTDDLASYQYEFLERWTEAGEAEESSEVDGRLEALSLVKQIEKDLTKGKKRNAVLVDWLTNVFSFIWNAHKSQSFVHFDYDSYQLPVAAIITVGLAFLLLGYFGTFYKFCFPTGKPQVRRMEKWLGRLIFLGYFYFVLTTCYLSWNFVSIVKPTISATSTCGAIADTKTFLPGEGPASNQFYRLKEFGELDSFPINPKWQRGGRSAPLLGRLSFLDRLGQIIQPSDSFEPPVDFVNFTKAINEWKVNIKKNCKKVTDISAKKAEMYVEKLKISIDKLVEVEADGNYHLDKFMTKDIRKFLQEIHGINWNEYQNIPAFNTSLAITSIDTLSTNINKKVVEAWKETSRLYNERHPRRLLLIADGLICGQWARSSVTLLVVAIIITALWVLCTLVMLSTARRWSRGLEEAVAASQPKDILAAPLIDNSKLEEALYDNRASYI